MFDKLNINEEILSTVMFAYIEFTMVRCANGNVIVYGDSVPYNEGTRVLDEATDFTVVGTELQVITNGVVEVLMDSEFGI